MSDKMKIKILADGTIRIETDPISAPNHLSAEQLIRDISKLAGGETSRSRKGHSHHHHHEHDHEHDHDHA